MVYQDLRQYLEKLEEEKELVRVQAEVDWNQEIGAITRRVCEKREAAPLFENIKDHPGHRLTGVLMGPGKASLYARLSLAFGLDKLTSPRDLINFVGEKLKQRIDPILVDKSEASCKEVILLGSDADLLKLPTPWIHKPSIEGGRYIGTSDIVITKDPDTGWVNWGTYRCMLVDKDTIAMVLLPSGQHGGRIFAKYQAMKKKMPLALILGADPMSSIAAMSPLPHTVSEIKLAGGLMGEPLKLVKCETIDLEVPANAEIVIELEVMPEERIPEGPFAEYTGHIHGVGHHWMAPVAKVKAITHRHNPIFTMANMGKPWDDWAVPGSILQSVVAKDWLDSHGVKVKEVYHHAPMTAMVISLTPSAGLIQKVISTLLAGDRFMQVPTIGLVFVEEDVDVTSLEDVWWSITTRMHPERFRVIKNVPANPLVPYVTPPERASFESSYWVMDSTFPIEWTSQYRYENTQVIDFNNSWEEEVKSQVLKRWSEYGY